MSITIEQVYEKLVELTELCERRFIDLTTEVSVLAEATAMIARRQGSQDSKLDAFIEDIIEMKRDLKHPI
jgi:hypothetical protein